MLVLGLGNPGSAYCRTRHNAGFMVVEHAARLARVGLRRVWLRPWRRARTASPDGRLELVEALTFMNRSGDVLRSVFSKTGMDRENLLVVCDSLDLPAGRLRLKRRGGSAGHNGLKSIIAGLGSEEFMRLYVGIGRPPDGDGVVEWVLGEPLGSELAAIESACEQAARTVLTICSRTIESVMNEVNAKND